ncbi:MAG: hypothetical protein V1891_01325 [bacterium]
MSERSQNRESMGVDPALKEQINKEGWEVGKDYNLNTEEETEGGAAVYVGNKEEVDRAKEIVETEGKAENLEVYIRMHKVIKVESDDIKITTEVESKEIHPGKAWLPDIGSRSERSLLYIDQNGNIAEVEIKIKDIKSFEGKEISIIKDELKKLGFDLKLYIPGGSYAREYAWVWRQITQKQYKLSQEAEENQKKSFNF